MPLAQAGAVDVWAIVHGRASRKLALLSVIPGIVQVRGWLQQGLPGVCFILIAVSACEALHILACSGFIACASWTHCVMALAHLSRLCSIAAYRLGAYDGLRILLLPPVIAVKLFCRPAVRGLRPLPVGP